MKLQNRPEDIAALAPAYQEYYHAIREQIPAARIICDPLRRFAYGVDASLYSITPQIVVQARSIDEVSFLVQEAGRRHIAVTFRAAGTSLCGQALTDSVLILATEGWQGYHIYDDGDRITLEPGIIGALANKYLAPYQRKIGPDPASIKHAMIGGIAANNASGMCCGTSDNSYKTVLDMKLVFADGSVLDTGSAASVQSWSEQHVPITRELTAIRDEIAADPELHHLIEHKFKIKNTTGYSLNAFVDYDDPIDILKHVIIGSEGTLALIAEITYRTVVEAKYKASALVFFPSLRESCRAVHDLTRPLVAAGELLDRVSLKSIEDWDGIPEVIRTLPDGAAAILIETRADDHDTLEQRIAETKEVVGKYDILYPIEFTEDPAVYGLYWQIRAGIFPAVGGVREIGTTVIIEDVAFPRDDLAEGVMALRQSMDDHGYGAGIIYGHVLDGNVHFVITQDFETDAGKAQYQKFIEDVCDLVATKFHGSLKAEHGTGRNMAPFVELEWGKKAYALMKRIKKAFDPETTLNPDVIITTNGLVFMEHIKSMKPVHEIVDRCIECGYCQVMCPSHLLTLSPRQRTAVQREMSRLRLTGENPALLKRFEEDYAYLGDETCAVDGLCQTTCPLSINTGMFTKELRHSHMTPARLHGAEKVAENFEATSRAVRVALSGANAAHTLIGTQLMKYLAEHTHTLTGKKLPLWNPRMPKAGHVPVQPEIKGGGRPQIVYFPSCTTRMMGPAKGDYDQRHLSAVMIDLCQRAGYDVIIPENIARYCCGMPFESEGIFEVADKLAKDLEGALLKTSHDGKLPILCDMSPCTYRMQHHMDERLHIYDTVEFLHDFIIDRLPIHQIDRTIMLHMTCSSVKMGLQKKFLDIAQRCVTKVVVPDKVTCCGFSGDKGFSIPELNQSALTHLNEAIPKDCDHGYSNSRTCEIGLSAKAGFPYQSIAYLVDECSR
ncbi:FAD-binding and (Fe-S)-binding domain-containing protein [Selenomonas sp.]|uniref:FAD-binding and (Fe-S)-binding domain-containing protein n=1 Tax=Selenomonas sp. TaxID=2053611 RepID=UPI002A75508B|nr:FAD-binding and (Fe-S)-binding domain-containing protein [Selenomonas sp.]MDY3298915.1 FAD-binding and (Fe-S)-binding domain-containing protein [Selenomonas sp.]